MTVDRSPEYLQSLLGELRNLPKETEWIEFKVNDHEPEMIGEYISALSNSAALLRKSHAFMIWGIDNDTHDILGTSFAPSNTKVGNEELENWILKLLNPKIDFYFYEFQTNGVNITLLEVGAAFRHPVRFRSTEYIRIGSYKKKLKEFPEKERALWRVFDQIPFEREIAAENLEPDEILRLIDYPTYFELLSIPLPDSRKGIFDALLSDEMIIQEPNGNWNVTNLGAILFAKNIKEFLHLRRKATRVIVYRGTNRNETIREQLGAKGYASGFEGLIGFIANLLPANEIIGQAFREDVPMFPELTIRELTANALIHQDFYARGTSPLIEIFSDRLEITNPGVPLVKPDRFLDSPPKSRNEALASFMRRIGVCEERGSGIDKVVFETEFYQLPAPIFESTEEHTRVVLFAHRALKDMDKEDRIRACYLHACLKYVQRDFMTNSTLRTRFGIEDQNSAQASRIIRETQEAGKIRPYDESAGKKFMKYVPSWA